MKLQQYEYPYHLLAKGYGSAEMKRVLQLHWFGTSVELREYIRCLGILKKRIRLVTSH